MNYLFDRSKYMILIQLNIECQKVEKNFKNYKQRYIYKLYYYIIFYFDFLTKVI